MIDGSDVEIRFLEEKAEIVQGFLQEGEIVDRAQDEKNDMRLAFEVEKENMRKAFECENEEMRQNFLKEKDNIRLEFQESRHVFKLSFEDEKSALIKSWDNYPLVSLPLTRRQQPPVNPFGHLY